ncbi:MAG: AraC family transcriptional regulator [Cyclobacteriaceae bacterium]
MKDFLKYLNASETDKNWGIYLTVVGRSTIPAGTAYPSSKHPSGYFFQWENGRVLDEFQINYIVSGQGTFESRDQVYKVQAGDCIILFPGVHHRYRPVLETGWTERYIGFKGDLSNHFMTNAQLSPDKPIIQCGIHTEMINAYDKIQDFAGHQRPGYHQVISGLLLEILGQVISEYRRKDFKGREKETEELIVKTKRYLWENLGNTIDMHQLAALFNVSYSNFRKIFKNYTGQPPNQYLIDLKILKAREWITTTDKSIKSICFDLGFESLQYFSRLFKQKTGLNPSDLRRINVE